MLNSILSIMRQLNLLRKTTITTISLLSVSIAFNTSTLATKVVKPHKSFSSASEKTVSQNRNSFQLAQVNSCRQVIAESGLYVREGPTIFSEAIGILNYGHNVIVQPDGTDRWVRISAPLSGYVYAGWLGDCRSTAFVPLESCRLVAANQSVPIRNSPSTDGVIVGTVASGRRVTIENRGANGWVPISVPLQGYISSDYLAMCRSRA
jgi:uncharacterized protein YgiM (DUF1202 family)